MNHSFNVEIATKYGMPCAVILEYFRFWISKNEADGRNFYDGHYWTFSSLRELSEKFPYLTKDQIWRAIAKQKAEGIIITGNFNKRPFDRTLWYTLTDAGWELFRECDSHFAPAQNAFGTSATSTSHIREMDNAPAQNAFGTSATPIPFIDTVIYPVIDTVNRGVVGARAREGDPEWMTFVREYENNIGLLPRSEVERGDLDMFFETFGAGALTEFIHYTARKHPDNPHVYFSALCRKYLDKGITTTEQAKAAIMDYDRQKGRLNGTDRGSAEGTPRQLYEGQNIV